MRHLLIAGLLWCPLAKDLQAQDQLLVQSSDSTLWTVHAADSVLPTYTSEVGLPDRLTVLVHRGEMSGMRWERVKSVLGDLKNASGITEFNVFVVADGLILPIVADTGAELASALDEVTAVSLPGVNFTLSEAVANLSPATAAWESLLILAEPSAPGDPELQRYARAFLSHTLRDKKYRLFYWPVTDNFANGPAGNSDFVRPASLQPSAESLWQSAATSTCGDVVAPDTRPQTWLEQLRASQCLQVDFDVPSLSSGFRAYRATVTDFYGPSLNLPFLLTARASNPPTVAMYASMLSELQNARTLYEANDLDRAFDSLQLALEVNPAYTPGLRLLASIHMDQGRWFAASETLLPLVTIAPDDAGLYRDLGVIAFELGSWEESETHLRRSLEVDGPAVAVLDRLSRIREELGDIEEATEFAASAAMLASVRSDLHFRHGDLLFGLSRSDEALSAFAAALDLDSEFDEARIRLAEIHIGRGDLNVSRGLIADRVASVPDDLELRMRYARLAERAGSFDDAVALYQLSIETAPIHEPAHFELARHLRTADRWDEALNAARQGLEAVPASTRLHLMKIDLLAEHDLELEVREALRVAESLDPLNEELLRRLAEAKDISGDSAAIAYRRWSEALEESGELQRAQGALRRGVVVALRDGDRDEAVEMAARLADFGDTEFSSLASPQATETDSFLTVPGGIRGLAVAAGIPADIDLADFVAEYARTIARAWSTGARDAVEDRIRLYLDTIESLAAYADRTVTNRTEILLDPATGAGYQRTENVLRLLGWDIRRSDERFRVEVRSGAEDIDRQAFASVLSFDQVEMMTSLESGAPFRLRLDDSLVPVIFDESYWLTTLMGERGQERSLFEEMLRRSELSRLYVGVASMSEETRQTLISVVESEQLRRRAMRLSLYGASISFVDGRLALPGGEQAAAAWEELVGATPAAEGEFLTRLMNEDGGKALAYYHMLGALPISKQEFLTRTPVRLEAFYDAFPFENESAVDRGVLIRRNDSLEKLARELPLDDTGRVVFPGSPRVWMAARSRSDSLQDIRRMFDRLADVTDPDEEILLDMLDRTYGAGLDEFSQIDNFLAVARIDAARSEPMDEFTALILAEHYGKYHAVFPYFAELPTVSGDALTSFFQAARQIERFGGRELNTALGEFHSLIELIVLLRRSAAISDELSASLFALVSSRFADIERFRDIPAAAFDSIEEVLGAIDDDRADSADEILVRALAGPGGASEFYHGATVMSVNLARTNQDRIRGVLEAQSITPLETLLQIYREAAGIAIDPGSEVGPDLERWFPGLLEITPSREDGLSGGLRDQLIIGRLEEVEKRLEELRREQARERPRADRIVERANQLIEELNPFLKTTLVGWVYAAFLSPNDLAISVDKYFVRRHVFFSELPRDDWPLTIFDGYSNDTGTFVQGGFGQIAGVVGELAKTKVGFMESVEVGPGQDAVLAAQLAAVRTIPWSRVGSGTSRFVASQLQLGREAVVLSGFDADLLRGLSDALTGLIGPHRRGVVIGAVRRLDFDLALRQLSSSDLFFLVDSLEASGNLAKLAGPLLSTYQDGKARVPREEVEFFGGYQGQTLGYAFARLVKTAPYEEYANILRAEPMGERLSHVALNLVESAHRIGLPVGAVALLAEAAVREFASQARMSTKDDWNAALDGMRSIDLGALVPLLSENQ